MESPRSMKSTIILGALAAPLAAALAWQQPAMPVSSTIAAKLDIARARTLPATSAAIDLLFSKVTTLRHESAMLEQTFGVPPMEKLDVAYAFSDGFAVEGDRVSLDSSTAVLCGPVDTGAMASAVKAAPGAQRALAGKLEVSTAAFAKGFWFAFPENGTVMVSSSSAGIAKAAAARDGRAKVHQAGSFLHGALASDAPAVVAIDAAGGAPNISLLTGGAVRVDANTVLAKAIEDTPGTARIEITLSFDDVKAATQAYASINGLKLLASLQLAKNPAKVPAFVQRLLESQAFVSGTDINITILVTAADIASVK